MTCLRPYSVIFQFAASKRVNTPYPTIPSQTRNANASKERRREYSGRSVKISTQKRILCNLRFGRPNICMHRERRDEILRNGFIIPSAGRPPGYGNRSVAASQRLIQSYHNYSLTMGRNYASQQLALSSCSRFLFFARGSRYAANAQHDANREIVQRDTSRLYCR